MTTATIKMPATHSRIAAPVLTPARIRADKLAAKLGIHPGTIPHGEEDDPFYSESNLKHLLKIIADDKAGKIKWEKHDLIDA
ncbi:MAG: hypothetical protein FWG05_00855 [Kiritimatiellaeota bacterium]|nr:hypothetical protein [Kiritimatiellota bacterium]